MDQELLIEKLQVGDELAFKLLFQHHHHRLLYFAKNILKSNERAEEVVGDVFVKVWELQDQFKSYSNFKAFLYIATKNLCLNTIKKAEPMFMDICNLEESVVYDQDVFKEIVYAELLNSVFEEVSKLPEKQRIVFNLSFLEGLTVEEIGLKLNMSATAVYSNKSRALSVLKRKFDLELLSLAFFTSLALN